MAAGAGGPAPFQNLADIESTCEASISNTAAEHVRKSAETRLFPLYTQKDSVPMLQVSWTVLLYRHSENASVAQAAANPNLTPLSTPRAALHQFIPVLCTIVFLGIVFLLLETFIDALRSVLARKVPRQYRSAFVSVCVTSLIVHAAFNARIGFIDFVPCSASWLMTVQLMIEQSSVASCQHIALVALTTVTTTHWNSFSVDDKIALRTAILNILGKRGMSMEKNAISAACKLIATISKLGWSSGDERFRAIVTESNKFLNGSIPMCIIGIRLLSELVGEINVKAKSRTFQSHRRVAVSFRDLSLLQVFKFGMAALFQVATRRVRHDASTPPAQATAMELELLEQTLRLLRRCLEFDFVGSQPDETVGDQGTIQVPSSWRELVQSQATMRLLFSLYRGLTTGVMPDAAAITSAAGTGAASSGAAPPPTPTSGPTASGFAASGAAASVAAAAGSGQSMAVSPAHAARTLELLTLWASVRRTLFSADSERRIFLGELVAGCRDIMRDELGLGHQQCFHRFCRLLGRLKTNYQLAELVRSTGYTEWVTLCAALVEKALASPIYAGESFPDLLGLWSKLVAAVPHLNAGSFGKGRPLTVTTGPSVAGYGSGNASAAGDAAASSGTASSAADSELVRLGPQVVEAYVKSRVQHSGFTASGEGVSAEALHDHEACGEEVLAIPGLFRFSYATTAAALMRMWDQLFGVHKAIATGAVGGASAMAAAGTSSEAAAAASATVAGVGGDASTALRSTECQLAWMVYVFAATVSGQTFGSIAGGCTDETMQFDAELIRRVLNLIELVGQRLDAVSGGAPASPLYRCDPRLELALLFFVQRIQVGFLSEAHGMPQPQKLTGAAQRGKADASAQDSSTGATDSSFLVPSANPEATTFGQGSDGAGVGSLGLTFGPSTSDASTHALSLISRLAGSQGIAASVEASGANSLLGGMLASFGGRSLTSKQTKFLELWRLVGKGDHTEVVASLISHMALCLRYWGDVDDVLKRTLAVLEAMAFSYTAGRLLNSLKSVDFLLLNHGPSSFPFLSPPDNGRSRTRFYMCLARLLFLGEDADERFESFFAPIAATLDAAKAPGAVAARTASVGQGLAGLGRDLRGIARAAHNRASYTLLFDSVIADGRMQAVIQGIASWSDVPSVVNPLLKFVVELTTNRGSRISFPSSSPNGVVLFKTVSEAVVAHAKSVMSRPVPAEDRYAARYKGISQAIKALSLCLSSGYCPLGVFALYRDAALDHALEAGLRLVQGMSHEDIHDHTKVAREVFSFLAVIFHSHLDKLVMLDSTTFNGLLRHLRDGVNSLDDGVAGSAAAAIDNLCTSFVRGSRRARPETAGLSKHLSAQPKIFEEIMKLLFQIVVFSEASMWTIARPLLAATLAACMVRPEAWSEFTATLVGTQTGAVKPRLASDLDKLMCGITKSLDAPNRERFTRAVHIFRVEALSYVNL